MALGYAGKLYILAFDHRGSFQTKLFGIEGPPTAEQVERISDAKRLIYEGMEEAVRRGAEADATGVLVDEQFGSDIPRRATQAGLTLAMPVEKSGQNEFDFEYGDDFAAHIETFDPGFAKVLVRYNPDDPDAAMNERQLGRLKALSDWLHDQPDEARPARSGEAGSGGGARRKRRFLFELLVPATDAQLAAVGGDVDRYDAELRPELMRRAIEGCQQRGIEVDVWKIEGVDAREDAEMLAVQARSGPGREGVTCVLLGRGASTEKVEQWLRAASTVDGFIGFAIGRSIWWDALTGWLAEEVDRAAAVSQVADNYLHFVDVYEHERVA